MAHAATDSPGAVVVSIAAAAAAGMTAVAGLVLVVVGLYGQPPQAGRPPGGLVVWWRSVSRGRSAPRGRLARVLAGGAAGLVVWLVSGWPVAGLAVVTAVVGFPALFGAGRVARRRIERLEALESWTRRLADLRAAGTGLEHALTASVRTCPAPIRGEVDLLAGRLRAGWRADAALYAFADDLDEVSGDLVVAVLLRQAERRGGGLTPVLNDLADTVAEEVSLRRRVDADRAKPRTTARWVTVITLSVAGLGLLNPDYVRPYASAAGQVALALIVIAFVACLVWMHRVTLGRPEPRFLTGKPTDGR